MTLPENYADGDVIHGAGIDAWTAAINANTQKLLTPLSYGAAGNGVTDDTAAIQSAITACASGGVVFFPPGKTFAYQGTLHVPQGVVLQGSGWVTEVPALKASTSNALISLDASYGGNDGSFQILRELLIDGNNVGQVGIYCDIIDRPSLHNVMMRNFTQAGIVCDGTQNASFVGVSVYDCATQATNPGGWPAVGAIMLINGAQNCHFYNVTTSLYANGNANARSILITDIATDSRFHTSAFGGGNGPHSFNGGIHQYGGTVSGSKPDYRIQIDACQAGTQFVFRDVLISGSPCNSALVSIDVDDATIVSFEDCELALNTNSGTSLAASGGQVHVGGTTRIVASTQVLDDTIDLSGTAVFKDANAKLALDQIDASGTANSSTYLRGDGSWQTPPGGSGNFVAGVQVAAPTGNATTDTAAIQAAHDSLPATGGWIQLQVGTYAIATEGFSISKPGVTLAGVGEGSYSGTNATVLHCTTNNATAITVTGDGCYLRDFMLYNTYAGQCASGYGIQVSTSGGGVYCKYERICIRGFYDGLVQLRGLYWWMRSCHILSPTRYGVSINNDILDPDAGDEIIDGCWFDMANAYGNATAAIHWTSADGLRIVNTKINGSAGRIFTTGIEIVPANITKTMADIFIHNCSIETPTTGINIAITNPGSYVMCGVQIDTIEFMATTTGINIGNAVSDTMITNIYQLGGTRGIQISSGAKNVHIGPCMWVYVNSGSGPAIQVDSGTLGPITIAPQHVYAGSGLSVETGAIFSNAASAVVVPDLNYRRNFAQVAANTTVTAFSLGIAQYYGGVFTVTASGLENNVGSFTVRKTYTYTNDTGTPTVSLVGSAITAGSTTPTLTATASAGKITITLASGATNVLPNVQVSLEGNGCSFLSSLAIGQ